MSSSYPITTSLKIVKELQYVKETIAGLTPSSASFTAIPTREFTPTVTTDSIKLIKIGATADIYKDIVVRKNYDLSINYAPINDALLASLINVTGTDSRNDTYTFLLSQQHNSAGSLVEQYQIARGCSPSQVTISLDDGSLVTIQSEWKALSLADWSTAHNLTSPNFASTLTATPYSAITSGSTPFTFDGISYDIRHFSTTINHNLDVIQVQGQSGITRIIPTLLDISLEVDVVYKDNTLSAATKAFFAKDVIMQLNSEVPPSALTLQFNDVWLEQYDENVDANDTSIKIVSYTGTATGLIVFSNQLVSQSSKHKYNMVGSDIPVSTSSQHTYNMKAMIAATSIQKYAMGGKVIATSVHVYDVTEAGAPGNFVANNFVASNFILDD